MAISALRPGDRPIRAVFDYGTYCASISGCGFTQPYYRVDFGLVTFFYAGTKRQEYVYVVLDSRGRPRLGGTLSASPPPVLSIPTPVESPAADGPGGGGITATGAIDLARHRVQTDAVLLSALAGRHPDVTDDQPDRLVWAVGFTEDMEICPPPHGASCWTRPGQIQVFLDYFTGQFLGSSAFAPA